MSILWEKTDCETESEESLSCVTGDDTSSEGEPAEISSLTEEEEEEGGEEGESVSELKLNEQEMIKQHQMRKLIKNLDDEVKRKDDEAKRLRKQSTRCQEQQLLLLEEKHYLDDAMAGSSVGCLGMLHGKITKLMLDLDMEKELEVELRGSLDKVEGELLNAQIAVGQYEPLREKLDKLDIAWRNMKSKQFSNRFQAETKLVENAKKKDKSHGNMLKEQQAAVNSAIEEWRKVNKEERAFLQTALTQHKAAKAKESHVKRQQHLEKRLKAILSLKDNIATSEGTIQAQQLLKQEREKKRQISVELEKSKVLEENGVPEEHFLRKKRLQQFQSMLETFKKKQEERKLDIVQKLLREEKSKRPRQEKEQSTSNKHRKKRSLTAPLGPRENASNKVEIVDEITEQVMSELTCDTEQEAISKPLTRDTPPVDVVEPEIRGLWDRKARQNMWESKVAPGDRRFTIAALRKSLSEGDSSQDECSGLGRPVKRDMSKAELRIMKKAMEKLRRSRVHDQIAAGRKFKGKAFNSKPQVLVFRNFDVGKVYTKKVKLTNVSYTVNRCQLEGVSDNMADFISVAFDPPGPMSAGISCTMQVTFSPQLNEDMEGEINFTSPTGPFAVPIKCITKKCVVSLDKKELDFGVVYLGETVRQSVTVYNAGALSTQYTIITRLPTRQQTTSTQLAVPSVTATSHPDIPLPTLLALQQAENLSNRSNYSIMTTVETLAEPDSSTGLGVIPHRLKSKSTGEIFVAHTNEQDTLSQDSKPQDSKTQDTMPQDSKTQNAKPQEQDTSPKAKEKPRPKSKDKSRPGSHKSQDTPTSKHRDTSTESRPKSRDTPTSDSHAGKSRDTSAKSRSKSQDSPLSPESQPKSRGKSVPSDITPNILLQNQDTREHDDNVIPDQDKSIAGTMAIQVGGRNTGIVPAFGSRAMELVFTPHTVDQHLVNFSIHFNQATPPSLEVITKGRGIDVPVYVEQEEIDFRICMLDRLYQSSVILRNRASTALRVAFQVPAELQDYLEVSPRHGVIQGDSNFSAQVKFEPVESLLSLRKYYTQSNDRWKMPIHVGVANQSRPVNFAVLAHVTPSELLFEPLTLDFGFCTTQESVVASLRITNSSVISQQFGFINLPSTVSIQPDDGFGELLPKESVDMEVTFSAKKPVHYVFDLVCKSALDKTYRIECKALGVLPPLELPNNSINFVPTCIGNSNSIRISINNPKLSRLNSAVIRGDAPPQGRNAFHFSVLPGCPITFSPQVGVVPLGESMDILVQFSPKLSEENIKEEAVKMAISKSMEEKVTVAATGAATGAGTGTGAGAGTDHSSSRKGKHRKSLAASPMVSSFASVATSGSQHQPPSESSEGRGHMQSKVPPPEKGSQLWEEAHRYLLMSYQKQCFQFTIPCFVSEVVPANPRAPPTYRPEHTLYLQVSAPATRPSLILAKGQSRVIDFGKIGTGDVSTHTVQVLNISSQPIKLQSSLLDPCGPFQLRNALRNIRPEESHDLILWFCPHIGGKTYDSLILYDTNSQLMQLRLVGVGIQPQIDLSLGAGENLTLDMGHAMAKDVLTKTFTLLNTSPINVRFSLNMESQVHRNGSIMKSLRTCNYSGQPPFVCVPSEGVVEGEGTKDVRVFFTPDHQSTAYSDRLLVDYNEKCACSVALSGKAWTNNLYVKLISEGDMQEDFPASSKESMIPALSVAEDIAPPTQPLLVMFTHKRSADSAKVTKRELEIGCIKSNLVKKTSGEYSFDMTSATNPSAKSFSFDTLKGTVEAGVNKVITITFVPPKDTPCSLIAFNGSLTLKGSIIQVHQLLLRALICE